MGLQDTIAARLVDATTALGVLDTRYAAERKALQARIDLLQRASKVVTPEIQALIDQLGLQDALSGSM